MLITSIKKYIRYHRRSYLVSKFADICKKYLRLYYNEDYFNITDNGEEYIIKKYSEFVKKSSVNIFDVGSNQGDWSRVCLDYFNNSTLYCFELVPETLTRLHKNMDQFNNVRILDYGLSNQNDTVDISWNKSNDETSSINPRDLDTLDDPWAKNSVYEVVQCKVCKGDTAVSELGVEKIHFLKIDVEGHELEVLKGFEATFKKGSRPDLIQFEYGNTYLSSNSTLSDVYKLLKAKGYVLGRLYTQGVDFKEYSIDDDNFRMGNYIAVNRNLEQLVNLLKEKN